MVTEKVKKLRKEFRKQTIIAIIAAFGFLIALSWRDFISEVINKIVESLGVAGSTYLYKLLSAITVTILAILGIIIATKYQVKDEEESKKSK